jgi:AraC-like DNA-binding protein
LDQRITSAVDYMQRNLARPIRMPMLADQANLSVSRFRQIFVAQTGTAPAQFLLRLRMRRARLLIERTFLTVKEIMALVGYNDPSHFTREFRRAHGVPPTALRASGAVTGERSAVIADASRSANRPTHRRIRQVKTRAPSTRCA